MNDIQKINLENKCHDILECRSDAIAETILNALYLETPISSTQIRVLNTLHQKLCQEDDEGSGRKYE